MDTSVLIQKQVRDNAQDLHSFMSDLKSWETEMKRKESDLSGITIEKEDPPVRTKVKRANSQKAQKKPEPRISSSDYKGWEKFDADRACEEADEEDIGPSSRDSKMSAQDKEQKLKEEAQIEKEKGNEFVKLKNWDEALKCYSNAIKLNGKDAIFYANRALCHLKKENLHAAECDCSVALALEPKYIKALQRRSFAREGLGSLRRAANDLQKILDIEPANTAVQRQLEILRMRMGTKGPNYKSSPVSTPSSDDSMDFPETEDPPKAKNKEQEEPTASAPSSCPEPSTAQVPVKQTSENTEKVEQSQPAKDPPAQAEPAPEASSSSSQGARPRQSSETSRRDKKEGTVRPIDKPPHLRSKKPLTRVPIAEIPRGYSVTECIPLKGSADGVTRLISKHINKKFPFKGDNTNAPEQSDAQGNTNQRGSSTNKKRQKVRQQQSAPRAERGDQPKQFNKNIRFEGRHFVPDAELERIQRECTPIEITDRSDIEAILAELLHQTPNDNRVENVAGGIDDIQLGEASAVVYTVPKSFVQFVADWRLLRGRDNERSAYLKTIPPTRLPEIFRNSLESDTLCEILKVILNGEDFCRLNNPVPSMPYVLALTRVRRFGALAMFMTRSEKEVVTKILIRCREKEGATQEEINDMKNKFEV